MDIDKYWLVFVIVMYKYIGIGLMGLLVLMVMPTMQSEESGTFFGAGTILVRDATGGEIFKQTVHNQVTDQGEQFIIYQVFETGLGTDIVDNNHMNTICIAANIDDTDDATIEATTAVLFDSLIDSARTGGPTITDNSGGTCIIDGDVLNATAGIAVIQTPNPFIAADLGVGATPNIVTGDSITGIAICQDPAADGSSPTNNNTGCTGGNLFAQVALSNITLNNQETADITYTFDISSSTT